MNRFALSIAMCSLVAGRAWGAAVIDLATARLAIDDVKALRAVDEPVLSDPYVKIAGRRWQWKGSLRPGDYPAVFGSAQLQAMSVRVRATYQPPEKYALP